MKLRLRKVKLRLRKVKSHTAQYPAKTKFKLRHACSLYHNLSPLQRILANNEALLTSMPNKWCVQRGTQKESHKMYVKHQE